MFCFVNDMVYMGVKLQVLIKYHTKEPHVCGVENFRVIDVVSVETTPYGFENDAVRIPKKHHE